jgi:trans-aconitate methyltransferase
MAESKWGTKLYPEKDTFVFDYGHSLIDILYPNEEEMILYLRCNPGQRIQRLTERAKHATGIDLSPEMITKGRLNYPSLNFQMQDAAHF